MKQVAALAALTMGSATALAGSLSGVVTDADGTPLAGVSVEAIYQTYGADDLWTHGRSVKAGATSGPDGRYHIDLTALPAGEYKAHAYRTIVNGGRELAMALVPKTADTFAGNARTERNFSASLVESTPDLPYGNGGIFLLQNAVLDYTDLSQAEVTLVPIHGGPVLKRRVRATGEGLVATGIAFGTYRVSVALAGQTLALRLFGADPDEPFAVSVAHDFTMGPWGNQFIVEARR